jgi:aqualysin 1
MKKIWIVLVLFVLVIGSAQNALASTAPSAPILATDSPTAINGQFIIVYKPGTSTVAVNNAVQNVNAMGGKVLYQYDAALLGFAAVLPDPALQSLARDPKVAYIEADQLMSIDSIQSPAPSWGLDRIDQDKLPLSNSYTYNFTGSGVTAYIIDTGIYISDSDFGGRATVGYDSVGDGRNGIDCNGHGTHVSGTVGGAKYGVAKDVDLVAVRVLNCSGSGTTSGVIAGINWVTSDHATTDLAVANMSLGGGASTSLDSAVKNSIADGITYAIAAGNNNKDACRYSPARVPQALTVGATTSSDARASYSNYGSCLDLFAPGSSITSDWLNDNTNTISGTSMATPHVTGVAALYLQAHPSSTPAQVGTAITTNATANKVTNPGRNSPNLLLYSLLP